MRCDKPLKSPFSDDVKPSAECSGDFPTDQPHYSTDRHDQYDPGVAGVPYNQAGRSGTNHGAGNGVGTPHTAHRQYRQPHQLQDDTHRYGRVDLVQYKAYNGRGDDRLREQTVPSRPLIDRHNTGKSCKDYHIFKSEGNNHVTRDTG